MSTNPETIRKRNSRNRETYQQRQAHLKRKSKQKQLKRAEETQNQRKKRLTGESEQQIQKRSNETEEDREERKKRENERKRELRRRRNENINETVGQNQLNQRDDDETMGLDPINQRENQRENENINDQPVSATNINKHERHILRNFRYKMDDIRYNACPVCNERIPGMTLVEETCHRCHREKTIPKKFSKENYMDPGELPEQLKGLTEIEEMLIAQVFCVMSVYWLRRGQNGYKGNVINFPQDIREFTTHLPRHPSSLNVLVVRRQSATSLAEFRDFTVRRDKVHNALIWLKLNNRYYKDITINNETSEVYPKTDP